MEDELQKVKRILKQWENDFYNENQRRPIKGDIDGAPENISRAYRHYSELKKARQQPSEVWGKALNKNVIETSVRFDEHKAAEKNPVMSSIGKKLLANASFSASSNKNTSSQVADGNEDDDDCPRAVSQGSKVSVFETAIKLINTSKPKTYQSAPMAGGLTLATSSFEKATFGLNSPMSSTFQKTSSFMNTPTPSPLVKTSFLSSLSKVNRNSTGNEDSLQVSNSIVREEAVSNSCKRVAPVSNSYARDISGSDGEDDDYASFRGKKQSKKKTADLQECKRALAVSPSGSEDEDNPKSKSKSKAKGTAKPRKKRQRMDDDKTPSNDNFVKLNMKVKKYQPKGSRGGGRPMTYRQRMMERRKTHSGDKCYKCGLDGHWARDCRSAGRVAGFSGIGLMDDDEDGDPNKPKPTGTCYRCGEEGHWARQCRGGGSNTQPDWAPGPNRADGLPDMFLESEGDREISDSEFPTLEEAVLMSRGIKTSLGSSQTLPEDQTEFDNDGTLGVVRSKYEKPPPVRCIEPLYRLNEDGSLPETPEEVYEGLQDFGFTKFRPGQETAVMRVLCGLSTLVVQSTGAGKSLCYQLAAYLYAKRSKCITLVVSPLVSLMQDQVSELPICIRGACIHTNMNVGDRRNVIEKAVAGELHFLLMSPEMIVGSSSIVGGVSSGVLSRLPPIAFTCIDEAHCVSEWSHHFRPSYLRVCTVLREHYGVKCMLGLTATATMTTAMSVSRHLGIRSNAGATIRGAPIPQNLKLSVSRDGNREQALTRLLRGELFLKCKSIIVYCTRREQTTRIAGLIRNTMRTFTDQDSDVECEGDRTPPRNQRGRGGRKFGRGKGKWNAECYHAGLTPMERKRVQEDFMCGRLRIVVATVAFGMGLNKQDIHGIIHYTMPKNIESYVQEIGRAGRNGQNAYCHLFLDCKGEDRNELKRHIFGRSVDRISVKKLVRRVFVPCKCHLQMKKQAVPMEPVKVVEGFDVTGLDEPWDENDVGTDKTEIDDLPDQRRVGVCPGHERALPVNELVHLLDMKEEVIETLLVYLELHPKKWIENQQPVFSQCAMTFYGGRKLMLAVAKKCPPVAVAIAKIKQKLGSLEMVTNKLEFNIVELSDMLGWDSGPVRKELKLLTWELGPEGSNKSGVLVDFNTLSYHFRSPGDLTDDELDEVVDFLMDRIETQEKTELYHLENFHEVLEGVSYKNVKLCCDNVDNDRSEKLRLQLHRYLESDPPEATASALSFTRESAALAAKDNEINDEIEPEKEKAIRNDVSNFVQLYGEDHKLSGRAIARIMHGIDSPRFPATSWGRNKRFWRSHLDVEFHTVRRIATRELVRCR